MRSDLRQIVKGSTYTLYPHYGIQPADMPKNKRRIGNTLKNTDRIRKIRQIDFY